MTRWRAHRPTSDIVHTRDGEVEIVRHETNVRERSAREREARAFEVVYPLLSTSVPTEQIVEAYRRELGTS
jgi:hypothetical protein